MKKRAEMLIGLVSENGEPVFSGKLTAVPLRDEAVIAGSMKFFNDPEPCMIHRSAVMNRIYMELENYFDDLLQQSMQIDIPWNDVPEDHKCAICFDAQISRVSVRKSVIDFTREPSSPSAR